MKKTRIILTTIVSAVIMCFAFCLGSVFAEDNESSTLIVSPTSQKIILTPGETYYGTINVSSPNSATSDLSYSTSIGSFSEIASDGSKDDYGSVDTETKTKYNEIMDWITIIDGSGTVSPNNSNPIHFRIDVPEGAPSGGQYATINVRDDSKVSNDFADNTVNIQSVTQIASIIYADVAGETNESATIFENSIPLFSFGGGITASSMVKNEGNIHTDATYVLQVWPAFASEDSEELYTNAENPETHLIMPETSRYVTTSWDDAPMVGIFKVKQTVSIFDQVSETTQTVIVCPMWLLFAVLIVVFFIIFWLVSRSRARKKSADK